MNKKVAILIFTAILSVSLLNIPTALNEAQTFAGVLFVIALILWMTEAIPLYVTSLLILFLETVFLTPLLQKSEPGFSYKVFMHPFFSSVIALFMGGLLLAKAGSKYKIDDWMAKTVIRFSGPRPRYILLGMMVTTGVLSMWMSNTATTAMMLIITMSIASGMKENDYHKAFFLGIPFAANLGGMGTPVGTPPNAIAMNAMQSFLKTPITFLDWMIASVPLVIILIILLWVILNIKYKEPSKLIENIQKSNIVFTKKTITVIVVFFITVILWLTTKAHGVSSGIIALIPPVIFLSFGILDKEDFQSIAWDVLFLVGGGASLAIAITKSGLAAQILGSVNWADFSLATVLFIFILTGAFFTTFMSNTATGNIIIPLIFAVASIPHVPVAVSAALAISASMSLPVSTPPNALAYSSGQVEVKDIFKTGFIMTIISAVLIFIAGYLWWPVFFSGIES